ncbi:MAG: serine/threonine phosphatase [Pleurocapsa sp.]
MLVCPQCQFENPQDHKFCQNCGLSLTDKNCCECEAIIPIEAEICNICGASNRTVLWVIVSQEKKTEELVAVKANLAQANTQAIEIKNLSDFFAEGSENNRATFKAKKQRDFSNRYTTETEEELQPVNIIPSDTSNTFIQGKVIDKHPLQKSHLATLQKQQMDSFAELEQNLDNSYLAVTQYWNLLGLPTHALPYLILDKYTPTVPPIRDAWQDHARGVVLLPDRSQWQLLETLCSTEKLPLAQIVWFLDEMAKLWTPLSQVSCSRSLLINNNLRVDEDWSFCLQQLYMDETEHPPTLQDLVQMWQNCLAKLERDDLDELDCLLEKVLADDLKDVEQLRLQLHQLNPGDNEDDVNTDFTEIDSSEFDLELPTSVNSQEKDFFEEAVEVLPDSSDLEEQATAMIPMQLASIEDSSCTSIGSHRNHNEDFFGVKTSIHKTENNLEKTISVRGMYFVCDGMGGHDAGEVASAMAVETLEKYFQANWQQELPDQTSIASGILFTNNTLYQTNLSNARSGNGRMGTTLVMALVQNTQCAIAHVGDSRIYRISRKHGLEKLTSDHEVGQREINRGVEPEIAYGRPDSYQLTQALGPRDNNFVRPEINFMDLTEDCLLLLCSDGLSDNDLVEKHWQTYLQPLISSSTNLDDGLFRLIEFANQHNGHDNITGILIRIKLKPQL